MSSNNLQHLSCSVRSGAEFDQFVNALWLSKHPNFAEDEFKAVIGKATTKAMRLMKRSVLDANSSKQSKLDQEAKVRAEDDGHLSCLAGAYNHGIEKNGNCILHKPYANW